MKVVLFCGGLGTRLRDYDESLPKSMVTIGYRPIIWHLMKYYAHFGHKDFVLCLGYKADVIKKYFLEYNECLSNDFVLAEGGCKIEPLRTDIQDWRITFVDTGARSPIGERLRRVREHVSGEEIFLANYTDCLTDMNLEAYVDRFRRRQFIAGIVTVPPNTSFHYVSYDGEVVNSVTDVGATGLRVNGGFFIFRQEIFDYLNEGDDLMDGPFDRLIKIRKVLAYEHNGFWKAMDTFKDKQQFDELQSMAVPPWQVWSR